MSKATGRLKLINTATTQARRTGIKAHVFDPDASRSVEGTERAEWRTGKHWRTLRKAMLDRAKCEACPYPTPATELDHLLGHNDTQALEIMTAFNIHGDLSWRQRFWSGPFLKLCAPCHNRKTNFEQRGQLADWMQLHWRRT